MGIFKKLIFSFLLLLTQTARAEAYSQASLDSRAINITVSANVVSRSCEIDKNLLEGGGTISLAGLPQNIIRDTTVDSPVRSKDLVINLIHCPVDAKVGISFNFTPDPNHPAYMANNSSSGSGDLNGVLLGLTDEGDNLLRSGSTVVATQQDVLAGTATAKIKVKAFRVAATDAGISGGLVSSLATLTINQN
ncbi:type 1 fimbrial protein [Salmonella enterica subsp. enterica serovar Glostrup]|nr:type 1 fimbrial protein [Salmonella enterica subsp. enterica serovar Glostrup]